MSLSRHALVYTTRGGMLSTYELRLLAEAASAQGDGRIQLTDRQEIVLRGVPFAAARRLLNDPGAKRLGEWSGSRAPNVVTTAAALGLPSACAWLTPGILADAVATFDVLPRSRVSLADAAQLFVPAIVGDINVLASAQRDLWHIHACGAVLPRAIRTQDLARAVERIEAGALSLPAIADVLKPLQVDIEPRAMAAVESYHLPPESLLVPAMNDGISARYLVELCLLNAGCPNVAITLTPWRELCVRGLDATALHTARLQLLRWRVPATGAWQRVLCSAGSRPLARRIGAALAVQCPTDAGVSWAVVRPGEALPEAHVVIQEAPRRPWRPSRFSVLTRAGLAARTGAWRTVAVDLRERDVASCVFDALTQVAMVPRGPVAASIVAPAKKHWRCGDCLTEYEAAYGDPMSNIGPGARFEALPREWRCPVCGAEKGRYTAVACA
jgi:rubredoxin